MKNNKLKDYIGCCLISSFLCNVVYSAAGLSGGLLFQINVKDDLFLNLNVTDPANICARIMFMLVLVTSFSLTAYSGRFFTYFIKILRLALHQIISSFIEYFKNKKAQKIILVSYYKAFKFVEFKQ